MSFVTRRQRGVGLVELMVGITIGLIVSAAASMVAVNQINEHRRLMLETQIQQDLRTAADLLQQDLRRAGFRGTADLGVWSPPTSVGSLDEQAAKVAAASPYTEIAAVNNDIIKSLTYTYARKNSKNDFDADNTVKDNEHFGFKWEKGSKTLFLLLGWRDGVANWEPITDPDSVQITGFDFNVNSQSIDLSDFCEKACKTGTCPKQEVREVSFRIVGKARHDPNVIRVLDGTERMRADAITGTCPA